MSITIQIKQGEKLIKEETNEINDIAQLIESIKQAHNIIQKELTEQIELNLQQKNVDDQINKKVKLNENYENEDKEIQLDDDEQN